MQTIEITTDEQLDEFIESATEATYFATEHSTSLAFVVYCGIEGDWYATRPPHEEDPKDTEGHWLAGVTLSVDSLTLPITVIDPRNDAADTGQPVRPSAPLTFYGASDDLLEVEGAVVDEFDALSGSTRVRLTAPDNGTLDVIGQYGRPGSALEWSITVEAVDAYPSWPIRFHERVDREGDPAVTIDAPVGTTVELVTR
jgi:hypothetical protein